MPGSFRYCESQGSGVAWEVLRHTICDKRNSDQKAQSFNGDPEPTDSSNWFTYFGSGNESVRASICWDVAHSTQSRGIFARQTDDRYRQHQGSEEVGKTRSCPCSQAAPGRRGDREYSHGALPHYVRGFLSNCQRDPSQQERVDSGISWKLPQALLLNSGIAPCGLGKTPHKKRSLMRPGK